MFKGTIMKIHDVYYNIYSHKYYLITEIITDSLNTKFKLMRENATDEQFWISEKELEYSFNPGYPGIGEKPREYRLNEFTPRPMSEVNFDY